MSKYTSQPAQLRPATENIILDSLPDEDLQRILPDLETVNFSLGEVVYHVEETIEYVYFPNGAMISVIATTPEGESAEVGVIGSEGIVGVSVLIGADTTLNENIIQLAGSAHRIKVAAVRKEFKRAGAFHDISLRFINLLMLQISQTALCNRLHTIEQRLARWLLLCHDRTPNNKLTLTQEFLAIMLGSNRATITVAAINLQNAGFINYKRGLIKILDREGLENFSCECYQFVKKEYDRFSKSELK